MCFRYTAASKYYCTSGRVAVQENTWLEAGWLVRS